MRVALNQNHIGLNDKLAHELNTASKRFSNEAYSKIENIDSLLLKQDISAEKKKKILIKKLHEEAIKSFSIGKKRLSGKAFRLLKQRIIVIRRIVSKLRSINYYLETTFLQDLRLSKAKPSAKAPRLSMQNNLMQDELEALEYTAYRLIGEVVMLDKKLLGEYAKKEKKATIKEGAGVKDLGFILRKESVLLEHLEAKLPPPKMMSSALLKEPNFTHWVARIFALLSYFEHICQEEAYVFKGMKKNKSARLRIAKKISQLIKEKSELIRIMQEKATSMKKARADGKLKKELHNLTTAIGL